MSFFGGGSSSSSNAPQPTAASADTKNALIDNIRREMAVSTAQNLIDVTLSLAPHVDGRQLIKTVSNDVSRVRGVNLRMSSRCVLKISLLISDLFVSMHGSVYGNMEYRFVLH